MVIVDDHLMVADSLATILSANEDMTVLAIAGTCASGLEAVARYQPDVLLLDQRLPDGLGTDSLEAMLAECPRMKVLLVTAGDTDDVLARAILAGAAGVIPKGKRAITLINAVRAVAHNEAVITPDALRRLDAPSRAGRQWHRRRPDGTRARGSAPAGRREEHRRRSQPNCSSRRPPRGTTFSRS